MKFLIEVDEADGQHLHRLLEQNSPGHLVLLVRTESGNGYIEVQAEGVHEVFDLTGEPGPHPHHDEPMRPYPANKLDWN